MSNKLVEKAKEIKPKRRQRQIFNEDEEDLVLAWSQYEITETQFMSVVKLKGRGTIIYSFVARCCRQMLSNGKLKVTK